MRARTSPIDVAARSRPARLLSRPLAWLDAWLTAYLPRLRRHRPRVTLELGPWLPGWVVRLGLAGLTLGLATLVDGGPVAWAAIILLSGLVAIWPSGVAPGASVIVLAVLFAARPEPPAPLQVAALIAGLPALVQLAAVLGRTGPAARIELTVLLAPLRRFTLIQVFVQPLALIGGRLAGQDVLAGPTWILLPMLAVAGLGLISYRWLPRLGRGSP